MSILRNRFKIFLDFISTNSGRLSCHKQPEISLYRTLTIYKIPNKKREILNIENVQPIFISTRFAGHSKWQNIRHVKAAKDAEKSAVSNKYSRMIRQAVRDGNHADPKLNFKLAQVIEQAKSHNVTNSCIEAAIKGASASKETLEPALFEIKGPGNCFLVVEALTDNISRTRQSIRAVLNKTKSSIAEGSSRHFFSYKGVINVESKNHIDKALEDAIEAGAEDVQEATVDDGKNVLQFLSEPRDFYVVKKKLLELSYGIHSSGLQYVPHIKKPLSDDDLSLTGKLYDLLENIPDVVKIYDNID